MNSLVRSIRAAPRVGEKNTSASDAWRVFRMWGSGPVVTDPRTDDQLMPWSPDRARPNNRSVPNLAPGLIIVPCLHGGSDDETGVTGKAAIYRWLVVHTDLARYAAPGKMSLANKEGIPAVDDQVFADGIGTISMIGGTVRLDFLAYSPTQTDAAGQPRAEFRQRVIMGLDAFLHAAEKIHEAAQALAARNIRQEPALAPPLPEHNEPEIAAPVRVAALKPPFP